MSDCKSIAFQLYVSSDNDEADIPVAAVVEIDEEDAKAFVRLAKQVKENDWALIEKVDYRCLYLTRDPEDIEEGQEHDFIEPSDSDRVVITADAIRFRGYVMNSVGVATDEIEIATLREQFGIE